MGYCISKKAKVVIQIIRAISKYSVCFCSHIVRSGIDDEARVVLTGLGELTRGRM